MKKNHSTCEDVIKIVRRKKITPIKNLHQILNLKGLKKTGIWFQPLRVRRKLRVCEKVASNAPLAVRIDLVLKVYFPCDVVRSRGVKRTEIR